MLDCTTSWGKCESLKSSERGRDLETLDCSTEAHKRDSVCLLFLCYSHAPKQRYTDNLLRFEDISLSVVGGTCCLAFIKCLHVLPNTNRYVFLAVCSKAIYNGRVFVLAS